MKPVFVRLKRLASGPFYGANEAAESYASAGVRFLRTTDLTEDGRLREGGVFIEANAAREYLLKDGDILLSRSGTLGRCFVYSAEAHGPCAYAGYLVRFVPSTKLDPRFFFYFTKSSLFTSWLDSETISSTIGNVNGQKFANLAVPDWPKGYQRAIANFLDRESGRVDSLIAHRGRLEELLALRLKNEIAEVMQRALRQYPCLRLKTLLAGPPRNGISPPAAMFGGTPTFSLAAVREGNVAIRDNLKYADVTLGSLRDFEVAKGDVLVIRGSGSRHIVGAAGLVHEMPPSGCLYPDLLIRVRPGQMLDSCFLVEFLNSSLARAQIEASAQTASGIWKITGTDIANLKIPRVPPDVQKSIVASVSDARVRMFQARAALSRSTRLLEELRVGLITEVVTGQIDVRDSVWTESVLDDWEISDEANRYRGPGRLTAAQEYHRAKLKHLGVDIDAEENS